ncbi:MAG: hypothetical protein US97_C0007G0019 [Microgenomates group bacterium GW2011_GWF1_38_5]|nr:MAG: hypothetical protein US97_C0007G0019 [Microgenomates group bacterium GW2011_GWF1_38_5]
MFMVKSKCAMMTNKLEGCGHEVVFGGFGYICFRKKGHTGKHMAEIEWSDEESEIIDRKWVE